MKKFLNILFVVSALTLTLSSGYSDEVNAPNTEEIIGIPSLSEEDDLIGGKH
jgi:hypothetical protein